MEQSELRQYANTIGNTSSDPDYYLLNLLLNEIRYISKAPSLTGGQVAVDVVNLDLHLARYWHNYIQPEINKNNVRADFRWDWRRIYYVSRLIGTSFGQSPGGLALVLNLKPAHQALIPVAMLQLVNRYPHFQDHSKGSTFLWYLSDAPREALQQLKVPNTATPLLTDDQIPKMLGTLALDSSVIHSYREGNMGRLGLHAAPRGGLPLINWYNGKGLVNIPASDNLPIGLRSLLKGNDGRYFCYNEPEALDATQKIDPFR